MTLAPDARTLADSLLADGVIEFKQPGEEGFELAFHKQNPDAPRSTYFVSLRLPDNTNHGVGKLTPERLIDIGNLLWARAQRFKFDHVAPIPNAGDPIGDALVVAAAEDGVKLSVVRLVKEGTGSDRRITGVVPGNWEVGDVVLLVDDLITHAATKREAIAALLEAGLVVFVLLVVLDREQGGVDELAEEGVLTNALFEWTAIIDYFRSAGRISEEQYRAYLDYIEADRAYKVAHGL